MENLTRENAVKDDFFGVDLDRCIDYLIKCREQGKSVYIMFNGQKLFSCDATVNSIYMQVLGKTKEEFEKDEQEYFSRYREEMTKKREESKANREKWKKIGCKYIFPERVEEWEKCVDITVGGVYGGTDLEKAITAMEMLESGTSFENVCNYIKGINTSGNSASLIKTLILNFSKKGPDFFEHIEGGIDNIDENTRRMIERIRNQNREYQTNEVLAKKGSEWRKRAETFIYPERMAEFERIMRQRAGEKFRGADIELALGAMELLDKGLSFEQVEKFIGDKSKTITGASMAENIVLSFSKKGPEFFESIRPGEATDFVAQLKEINSKLADRHRADRGKTGNVNSPREELTSLVAQKRSLEAELRSLEAELNNSREQTDKTKGREI